MKRLVLILLSSALCPLISPAAVTLRWTVETSRVQPAVFDAVRGETLTLQADLNSYGTPVQPPSDAAIFWQTNGMGTAWWTAAASVASNRLTATFTPQMDPGGRTVTGFIGTTGEIYRAAFTLRFRNGPGATPNALPLPTNVIDCAAVTFLNPTNAPWSTGGGTGGGVDTNAVRGIVEGYGYLQTKGKFTWVGDYDHWLTFSGHFEPSGGIFTDFENYRNMNDVPLPVYLAEGGWNTADDPFARVSVTNALGETVRTWEEYWRGDRVRLSVTNYYGNTSGEPPRLRIEESVTNSSGEVESWRVVWDEQTRQTNFVATVTNTIATLSNTLMTATYRQTYNQLGNKAPRAWQTVTSAGGSAPDNTVWLTAPTTVFAGGTEYAHVAVGDGTIAVLVDKGAPVYTEADSGQFRFFDESGQNYFGFDIRQSYTIGCRTDGISVDEQTQLVTLSYDLESSTTPTIYHSTNLTDWAVADATWEPNPPTGQQVCYVDCGDEPKGFYKASLDYAGGAKFVTNMQADLSGGIAATNEVLNVVQSIYPVITSTGIVWRVRQ